MLGVRSGRSSCVNLSHIFCVSCVRGNGKGGYRRQNEYIVHKYYKII